MADPLVGKRFGRLLVTDYAGTNKHKQKTYDCLCACGVAKTVLGQSLKRGATRSCGCLARDSVIDRKPRTVHGHTANGQWSGAFRSWQALKTRLRVDPHYVGVQMHDGWLDFSTFLADVGDRPPGMSLERIDNAKGYFPGNVRWATPKEQANNRRSSRIVKFDGREQTLAQWSDELGINYGTLHSRLDNSRWSVEKAFTTPVR